MIPENEREVISGERGEMMVATPRVFCKHGHADRTMERTTAFLLACLNGTRISLMSVDRDDIANATYEQLCEYVHSSLRCSSLE